MPDARRIEPIEIEEEMQRSFLDYAMSVIVARALPDVRDGLKPVHRRILWGANEEGVRPPNGRRKSAYIVGSVLGKYHPHSDTAVYDAMVRLGQDFASRYPLIDGQGNFGTADGDEPAAMRYTEARLNALAMELLRDIDKETVDFTPNYDNESQEPVVLPARFPNLLANGSEGIAVGMATKIPPHNLGEVIDATVALIDNPELTSEDLLRWVKGPDFPTGASIMGTAGIRDAFLTGRGSIRVRSKVRIEENNRGGQRLVVTELPYQVSGDRLLIRIRDLVREGRLNGIVDIANETNKEGTRLVIECRRDAVPQVVLNQLYKHTQLQDSFGVIMLALVDGVPRVLNLADMLSHYIAHQVTVVVRRTRYELRKAKERAHILEGLLIALDHLDEVINLIRNAESADVARTQLMERYDLSELQATAILDMQLRRLAALERRKLQEEYAELQTQDRRAPGHPRRPLQGAGHRQGGAARHQAPLRRPPADRDPPRRGRAVDRGPDRGRAGGGHRDQDRLREAGRPGRLPGPEPGWPRGPRGQPQRGRHRPVPGPHQHPPLGAVLHQQGPGVPGEGARAARGGQERPRHLCGQRAGCDIPTR